MYELIPRISTSQGTQKFSFLYPEPTVLRQSFSFGGREFQVAITAGHLYLADHYSLVHWLVLPFGFALTILLALYLQALLSRQAKAEALVEKRTAELSISEQKYRGLFEQNKDGLVVCDLHGMIMDANRSTLRMIGYSSLDEIRGRPYSDFVPEKWHALDAELITNELAKKGYSEFYERECIHRDGTIFPVNCRTWLIREAGTRKVTSATIWFQDISERRKAEVILSETASRLNEAQYLAHIGSWELNLENHEIQWSPELFRILERDPSVSSPSFGTFIVLVHPLDREKVKQAFSFTGIGEQPQNIEYRLLMPDGRIKYIQQFFRMFFDGSGKPHHTAGTIQDVSERKKLEIEARLNQLRTDSLIRITQTSFPKIADLLDYALDEAIRLTESKIGYIYYYDDAKQEFILNTWSKDVMQECTVNDRENLTRYDLAKTGIWGEAVRQAKPIVINNFAASHPLKKGYPEGHVPLHRFLTIPVFSNSRIVAVVGVANKDTDYSDEDVHQLTLLMGSVWQIRERRRAEEVVKEYEQRYRSMFENNRAVMFMVNPETGRIIDANNAACSFYGYEKQEFVSLNISDISIMTKDEISERMQQAKSLQKESFVFRHRQKDGEVRDVEVFSGPISVGEQTVLYSIVHDITERRHAEKALRESEERFRDQFNGFPIPTYIWKRQSHDFQLVDYNNAALDFTRGKITEFKGIPASLFYEGRQWIIDDMNKCINEQAYIKNEFWDSLRTTGEKKFLAVRYTCLPPDLVMMHMEDITLQKEAQEHLVYMSIHDPMTGLYNRFYADSEIKRLKTSRKYPLSIIMVDIDGLKTVNDTGGHAAGDMLINNTAYILRQTFRPEDMVARIGGDEFLILLPSMDTATLDQTIRRLKVYLENFNASAPEVPVSFSIGAATVSSGDGIEESIKQADSLMYRDKALKKRPMDQ